MTWFDQDTIVVHGWQGSRPEYINTYGEAAPTWGCLLVDDREKSNGLLTR